MGILIGIVAVIGLIFISDIIKHNKEKSKLTDEEKLKEGNSIMLLYHGGFDDVSAEYGSQALLYFNEDTNEFEFRFKHNHELYMQKNVPVKNIKNVRYLNERNITSEISLGKMVVFGFLALGMQNKKVENEEYVVIDILRNDRVISVITREYLGNNSRIFNYIRDNINKGAT